MICFIGKKCSGKQVPEASNGKGVVVRVVAGVALGVSSPVRTITPTYYLGKGMIMIMIQI